MIDVLMATYNGESYIREQLDSILEQSYKDIRIIISDDGSSDETLNILADYTSRFPDKIFQVKKVACYKNAAKNFLSLIKYSASEYIMFSDQDDIWIDNKIGNTYKKMHELEKALGKGTPLLVYSDLSVVDEELNIINKSMKRLMGFQNEKYTLGRLLTENIVNGNTMMLNRALIREIETDKEVFMHDWYIALIATVFGKTAFIDEPMTLYRQHGLNTLGAVNPFSVKELFAHKKRREHIKSNYKKMFLQANSLLEILENKKRNNEKNIDALQTNIDIVRKFLELENMGRLKKIKTILKYGFFKNSVLMTVGMMLNI